MRHLRTFRARARRGMPGLLALALPSVVLASGAAPASVRLTPVTLAAGINTMPDIAGTGEAGSIAQLWRQNNKVRGQHVFLVKVGEATASFEGREQIEDKPDVGDDVIRSVRFARGEYHGVSTLYILTASRDIGASPYESAPTRIQSFALVRSGGAFTFAPVQDFPARGKYCHADAALLAELNFPLSPVYAGRVTPTGC
ncbi:hypothetical protein [Novosphingobium sp.]|uniref:hypothetical protein n=1 Tax=Novosphingobium sp. TaxID=1874826 RepID=UPI0028ABEFBD|nr:hypothetical protein [Novosphingobium sp.]